jgi:hypothetical protein
VTTNFNSSYQFVKWKKMNIRKEEEVDNEETEDEMSE